MEDKKKIKIYYGLLITLVVFMGVSYAWFRMRLTQTNSNVIGTRTCLDASLTEDTSKITLSDAFPISDEDGLKQTPFTFTLKNNCDSYVKVYITIDSKYRTSTDAAYLKDSFLKVNLSSKGTTDGSSVLLGSQTLTELEGTNKGYILVTTGLKASEEKSYDLRVWMNGETSISDGLNKNWEGKIVVVGVAANEPATLRETILANNEVKTPITAPGKEVSTASEALLASTPDDYGTSYYFRGAVKNNYVEFANKCWRIVRVGGDGSVKLILHNDNTAKAANPCNSANNSTTAAFARYSGTTYKSAFNTNADDNAYVGFMYGTPGSSTYADTHANTNKSTILTNLETWYNNNLKTYESVIDDNVWCNDKTNVTDTTYKPLWADVNGLGLGYGKNVTYYGATKRLVSTSDSAGGTGPSLKCNGELSKINSKVGLITADELAFAGYAYNIRNTVTYLKENTSGEWWSLSPSDYISIYANVWTVESYGTYFTTGLGGRGGRGVHDSCGVRPLISLKSTTNVTGNGSSDKPYKVV